MWNELGAVAPGDRLYRGRRLSVRSGLDLRVGYRETDGAPCLITAIDRVDTASISMFETGGLRLGCCQRDAA